MSKRERSPPPLTKLLFLSLKDRVQRSAPSRMGQGTLWLACLSGYKLQRHTAIHSQRWEQRSQRQGHIVILPLSLLPGDGRLIFFHNNWAFFSLSTMGLKNMISSFESFGWLQTFSERPKCRDSLWSVSFRDWSIDGTVGSCYGSVASSAKEEEGKNIHLKLINSGSEKKKKILSSMLKCHLPNIIL